MTGPICSIDGVNSWRQFLFDFNNPECGNAGWTHILIAVTIISIIIMTMMVFKWRKKR